MAINYLAALAMVPWDDVLRNAPAIIEKSKRLWDGITKKSDLSPTDKESRISTLEAQVAELQHELVSSADILKALAEQNSQLVQAVAVLQNRIRYLIPAVWCLGIAVVVLLALTIFSA